MAKIIIAGLRLSAPQDAKISSMSGQDPLSRGTLDLSYAGSSEADMTEADRAMSAKFSDGNVRAPSLGSECRGGRPDSIFCFLEDFIVSCRICKIVKHYQQNKVLQLNSCNSISKQFDFVLAQAADSPEPI